MSEGFVEVPEGRVFYEEAGDGPPVVFVHGGLWDRRMWEDQWGPFAARHRVVRFDLRGFGRSSMPTTPFIVSEDIRLLLDHLEIPRAAVVGLSLGGALSLEFALDHPEMLSALVLAAAGARGFTDWSSSLQGAWDRADRAAQGGDHQGAMEIELDTWTPRTDPATDDRVRAIAFDNIRQYEVEEAASMQRSDPPAIGRLHEIRVPTLVVLGRRDQPDINRIGEILAAGIAGATLEWLDADHVPNMRRPAEFNRLVLRFLRETAGQS